jgi:hypothetical protein
MPEELATLRSRLAQLEAERDALQRERNQLANLVYEYQKGGASR